MELYNKHTVIKMRVSFGGHEINLDIIVCLGALEVTYYKAKINEIINNSII